MSKKEKVRKKNKKKSKKEKLKEKLDELDENTGGKENGDGENPKLEEVIEQDETSLDLYSKKIENIHFEDFSQSNWKISQSKAPVLEELADSEPAGPRFFSTGAGTAQNNSSTEGDRAFTYTPSNEENSERETYTSNTESNEPAYTSGREQVLLTPEKVNMQSITLNTGPRISPQETFITKSREASFGRGWGAESIRVSPKDINVDEAGRQNPIEADIEKHKQYKPDRPSSE